MQLQPCFGSFFIYSLFFAGESPILVKNVEVAFEINPRHPISRGNMSVDQSFLVHFTLVFVLFQFPLMRPVDVGLERDR